MSLAFARTDTANSTFHPSHQTELQDDSDWWSRHLLHTKLNELNGDLNRMETQLHRLQHTASSVLPNCQPLQQAQVLRLMDNIEALQSRITRILATQNPYSS